MGGPDAAFGSWSVLVAWVVNECGQRFDDVMRMTPWQIAYVFLPPRDSEGRIDRSHGPRPRKQMGFREEMRQYLWKLASGARLDDPKFVAEMVERQGGGRVAYTVHSVVF